MTERPQTTANGWKVEGDFRKNDILNIGDKLTLDDITIKKCRILHLSDALKIVKLCYFRA